MQPHVDSRGAGPGDAVVRVKKQKYPMALRILSRWIAARHGLDVQIGAVIDRSFAVFEARASAVT